MANDSKLTKSQYKSFGPKPIKGYGKGAAIWAHVRFDDSCGNGHNTFAITASVRVPGQRDTAAGGCLHDEIAEAFPELAPLTKWHLCSTDGPLHYLANTCYHAGDKDHNGKRAGEPSDFELRMYFKDFPLGLSQPRYYKAGLLKWLKEMQDERAKHFEKTGNVARVWMDEPQHSDFEVISIHHDKEPTKHKPEYTFGGYCRPWAQCPFDSELEAIEVLAAMKRGWKIELIPTAWSNGKPRELDHARSSAIWPDATDDELTAPGLKERLIERLPKLLTDFRAAVESLGFTW